MRLKGKTAFVTGGASGIGRETCLIFAQEGANVVVADIQYDKAKEVAEECKKYGVEAIAPPCDVTNLAEASAAVKAAVDKFGKEMEIKNKKTGEVSKIKSGGIDILVCCAGILRDAMIHRMTEEQWDACMSINLTSVWLGMKYAIPEMLATGGGTIINNASISGIIAFPGGSAEYAAAKAAVIMLTKKAAVELAQSKIRVNCICPGHCLTPMIERGLGRSEEAIAELNQRQPMGRMGTPDEVSQAALFLACEESSSFITGAVIVVDGGHSVAARGKSLAIQEYGQAIDEEQTI